MTRLATFFTFQFSVRNSLFTHIKPQGIFVFPDGHLVIVLASGRLRILG